MTFKKSFAQIVITIFAAVTPLLAADQVTPEQWINVAILAVGAFSVYAAPNVPGAEYTKMFIAAATAALTAVTSLLTNGITLSEWIQVGMAFAGAILVQQLKNDVPEPNVPVDSVRAS